MINATPPGLPNQDVPYADSTATDPNPDRKFAPRWYRYLDQVVKFLIALRNAPQPVEQVDLASFLRKLISAKMQPGVQVWVPGFNHLLRYDGSKYTFAPGDTGSGYTQAFLTVPTAQGWVLCNGSTVSFLLATGAVANQVLPNTAGLYFRR